MSTERWSTGGNLYNYSDMTGSTLCCPPNHGTWTVSHDSGIEGANWINVNWSSLEPSGSSITVRIALSDDGEQWGPWQDVINGGDPTGYGRYLKIRVALVRSVTGATPALEDLTVEADPTPNGFACIDSRWFTQQMDPYGRYLWDVRFHVADGDGNSLPGVLVDVTIDPPTGGPYARTRVTKSNGWARFVWGDRLPEPFQLCVDNLTKPGCIYDPGRNTVPNCVP